MVYKCDDCDEKAGDTYDEAMEHIIVAHPEHASTEEKLMDFFERNIYEE